MPSWSNWFRESFFLTLKLLKHSAAPLTAIFASTIAYSIYAEDAMHSAAYGESRWDLQIMLGVLELVTGVVLILVLSQAVSRVRDLSPRMLKNPFETPYLGSFLAEYLRMLAQILLYGLLLIVPGIFRYFQLTFVPFLALFSKEYRQGDLDALKASERLFKEHKWRVFAALALTMAIGAGFEFLPQMVDGLHDYSSRVFFYLLSDLTSVWAFSLLFLLFESALAETRLEDL